MILPPFFFAKVRADSLSFHTMLMIPFEPCSLAISFAKLNTFEANLNLDRRVGDAVVSRTFCIRGRPLAHLPVSSSLWGERICLWKTCDRRDRRSNSLG